MALQSVTAHSTLDHSEPKAGAVLEQTPNELRLWFTEPLKIGLSTVEVRNAAGQQVDRHDLRADEKHPALVHLSLGEKLPPGTYHVSWTAVAQDMHVSKGTFSLQVAPK
ncbi:MAG: copper resistance CopC family protein [Chthoniobacterales bacterium]